MSLFGLSGGAEGSAKSSECDKLGFGFFFCGPVFRTLAYAKIRFASKAEK
jgi:hypothetical protein